MRTLVVGVGNEDRGDDGLGPLAARLLADALAPLHAEGDGHAGGRVRVGPSHDVEVVAWTGDPMGLVDRWAGFDRLVLIDAVVSGAEPGTTRRYGLDAPFAHGAGAATHGFGVAAALALGRAMARLPRRVEVWGVEAVEFAAGAPLTPAVARAVLSLVDRLRADLGAGSEA